MICSTAAVGAPRHGNDGRYAQVGSQIQGPQVAVMVAQDRPRSWPRYGSLKLLRSMPGRRTRLYHHRATLSRSTSSRKPCKMASVDGVAGGVAVGAGVAEGLVGWLRVVEPAVGRRQVTHSLPAQRPDRRPVDVGLRVERQRHRVEAVAGGVPGIALAVLLVAEQQAGVGGDAGIAQVGQAGAAARLIAAEGARVAFQALRTGRWPWPGRRWCPCRSWSCAGRHAGRASCGRGEHCWCPDR